ncbi:MAG: DHCW motif cupin fold protein [Deltaproteobacteria bacterium]|nr:DHCW motif cupin fold protein [Deltaproteobacteria bacterium]
MQIQNVPFCVADWKAMKTAEQPGETGISFSRTFEQGNIRVRMVEYSPGYMADHWCTRGHVLLVLEGKIVMELKNGKKYPVKPSESFQVADNGEPHRVYTEDGARVFIVD